MDEENWSTRSFFAHCSISGEIQFVGSSGQVIQRVFDFSPRTQFGFVAEGRSSVRDPDSEPPRAHYTRRARLAPPAACHPTNTNTRLCASLVRISSLRRGKGAQRNMASRRERDDRRSGPFRMSPRHVLEAMFRSLSPPARESSRNDRAPARSSTPSRSPAPVVSRSAAPPPPPEASRAPQTTDGEAKGKTQADEFVQSACDGLVEEADQSAVAQAQQTAKLFGCDGCCGFQGSYEKVAEHERSCKEYSQAQASLSAAPVAAGSLQEWRQKTGQPCPAEKNGAERNSECDVRVPAGAEKQESQGDALSKHAVNIESTLIPREPVPARTSSRGVGSRTRPYEIAVDCTSKLVVTSAPVEIDLPYPVSPRAVMEDHFKMLEQGIDVLPNSPRTSSPPPLPISSKPPVSPASPRPDRSAYSSPEDEMRGAGRETEGPVVSPRGSIQTWQQRTVRCSPTTDGAAESLLPSEAASDADVCGFVRKPLEEGVVAVIAGWCSDSVTHAIESALEGKRVDGGEAPSALKGKSAVEHEAEDFDGADDGGEGATCNSARAIEISSVVASPAPMAAGLAERASKLSAEAEKGDGNARFLTKNSGDRSPMSPRAYGVHEHKDLLMTVLEQQKTIARMQVRLIVFVVG